ncbi:MAG: hypothetical protein IT198_10355 [Acidimicrobiia bacterium]|nr:hypothetical protein [Acidimicrobiia bacterium]
MKRRAERRLRSVSDKIRRTEDELATLQAQLGALDHEVDAARIDSLVTESPLARVEHDDAVRMYEAMVRERDRVTRRLDTLRAQRDAYLDDLT